MSLFATVPKTKHGITNAKYLNNLKVQNNVMTIAGDV